MEKLLKILTGEQTHGKEEQRKAEEADWHGKTYTKKVGGFASFLNKWNADQASKFKGGASRKGP